MQQKIVEAKPDKILKISQGSIWSEKVNDNSLSSRNSGMDGCWMLLLEWIPLLYKSNDDYFNEFQSRSRYECFENPLLIQLADLNSLEVVEQN